MKELAGLSKNPDKKLLSEKYFTQDELMQQAGEEKEIEDLITLPGAEMVDTTETINNEVESAEEISANAENLYPGTRYYGMYSGEHMMQENKISDLDDDTQLMIDDEILS